MSGLRGQETFDADVQAAFLGSNWLHLEAARAAFQDGAENAAFILTTCMAEAPNFTPSICAGFVYVAGIYGSGMARNGLDRERTIALFAAGLDSALAYGKVEDAERLGANQG